MQIPANVGKYELLEFLGGGMSHVYRARDTVIDRPVVVKLLTVEACQDAEAKARFLHEAKLAGNIQHENIVSVFDFGEHDGRPFLVMEYLKGEDLRDAIRAGHCGSLIDRMKVALQVAGALEYVNGRGIVHRDIKPENVHISSPNGRVKLMDFGIAKTADLSLTRTGMAMGTPFYMAPEQVSGKPPTPLIDVYAFGMLFYELLTGVRGVNGDTIEAVLYQILNVPLDPAPMVNAGIPPQVRALVLRCAEKKPEDRPQGFGIIGNELRGLIAGAADKTQAVAAKTVTLPVNAPPRRSFAIWVAAGIAVIAIAAGAAWFALRTKAPVTQHVSEPATQPAGPLVNRVEVQVPAIPGMTYIPAGTFLSGEQNTPVSLPGFYIDEVEVSNGDYAEFCRATGCTAPRGPPDLPMVSVKVAQARDYATWKGRRLPSALEWERAARGTDGAKYPWGDAADPSLANVKEKALKPVRSYAAYRGVYQMAGNAWEMVEAEITPSPKALASFSSLLKPPPTAEEKWITIRGGSFHQPLEAAYEWSSIPERYSSSDIGFRCARSLP